MKPNSLNDYLGEYSAQLARKQTARELQNIVNKLQYVLREEITNLYGSNTSNFNCQNLRDSAFKSIRYNGNYFSTNMANADHIIRHKIRQSVKAVHEQANPKQEEKAA